MLNQDTTTSQKDKNTFQIDIKGDDFSTTYNEIGLTKTQVAERISKGLVNKNIDIPTKTIREILFSNIFTLFNLINVVLGITMISIKRIADAGFLFLILFNTLISTVQEIKAKITIDKLSLISAPKIKLLREGREKIAKVNDIVMDDIMILSSGNQICADSEIISGECEVNESLITGESDAILKRKGDKILSGSFVVSGYVKAKVYNVGQDNYAAKISKGAKYIKKPNSEILKSIRAIIRLMTMIIIPLGLIIIGKQIFVVEDQTMTDAITKATSSIINMIPSGLVLLITMVFAVSVIRLAKHKTLVQDLYCIETLARVDVLCLDKTGTITEGTMQVDDVVILNNNNLLEIDKALSAITHSLNDDNPTFKALVDKFRINPEWHFDYNVPFSSSRKWSGVHFTSHGSYIIGAGEFVLKERYNEIEDRVNIYTKLGQRVLVLVHSNKDIINNKLPDDLEIIGLILLSDKIRAEAPKTLEYFASQGVEIKIISGDNPITVSQIAKKVGLKNADKYIDATTIQTEDDMVYAINNFTIFGRVTPDQKLSIVKLLKKEGHTVAMTGDGVNDVLALKESDCSVAMMSGSDAAKNVSSLILLDNNFASMPKVVAEGRRSINNLQRSTSMFLIKTIYATVLGLLFIFVPWSYPFIPRQLTLVSALTVAIPSFIIALEPNTDIVKGHFIDNAIKNSLPGAFTILLNLIIMLTVANAMNIPNEGQSTLATILLGINMFIILFKVCLPFTLMRATLFLVNFTVFIYSILFLNEFLQLCDITREMLYILIPMLLLCYPIILATRAVVSYYINKNQLKFMKRLLDFSENKLQNLTIKKNKDDNINENGNNENKKLNGKLNTEKIKEKF